MKEARTYFDSRTGNTFIVNLNTRQVRCAVSGEYPADDVIERVLRAVASRVRAAANRKAREDVYRSCGLTKVRGNLGGVYWE